MNAKRTLAILALTILLVVSTSAVFAQCGTTQTQTLYAGKTIPVGTVSVWNDPSNLYVKYLITSGDWYLGETHLSVATSLYSVRHTRGGPVPGKFPYVKEHDAAVTEYTYVLPKSWGAGTTLYILAHAQLYKFVEDIYYEESAWAAGSQYPGRNWATYFTFSVRACP
jgi:hypothetical protein